MSAKSFKLFWLFSLLALVGLASVPHAAHAAETFSTAITGPVAPFRTSDRPTVTISITGATLPATTVTIALLASDGTPVSSGAVLTSTGSLGTNNTTVATGGTATFTGVHVTKPGTYVLKITDTVNNFSQNSIPFTVFPGVPGAVTISSGPTPASLSSDQTFSLSATVLDADMNPVADNTAVTLGVSPAPTPAATGLSASTMNGSGIATFSAVQIKQARAAGYTLTATATTGGIVSTNTATVVITAGIAAQLALTSQPATNASFASGAAITPVSVQIQDDNGNSVGQAGVTVTLTLNAADTNPAGTLTVPAPPVKTNGSGLATFSTLSVDKVGSKTLTADTTLTLPVTSNQFTITAGAAKKLAFGQQPTDTASGATINQNTAPPGVTVLVEDAAGNTVTTSTAPVTLTLTTGTGTLTGGGPVAAVSGVATFNGLSVDTAGMGKVLTAKSGTLLQAASSPFAIGAGTPSQLVFGTQPSTATAGAAITPAVTVLVEDASNNVVTTSTAPVTLTLPASEGTLTGGGPVAAVNGVATFPGLSINAAGMGKVLTAKSGTLLQAASSPFAVTASAVAQLAITSQPAAGASFTSGAAITPVVVQLEDANGNPVPTPNVAITVALTTGAGTLGGTLTQKTDGTGAASFGNLSIDLAGTNKQLTVDSQTVTVTALQTNTFAITAGAAAKLAFGQQPNSAASGGTIAPAVTVQVEDAAGNPVTTSTAPVTLTLPASEGTLTGGGPVAAVGGVATFNALSVNAAGQGDTLTATSTGTGLTSATATSNPFNVTAGGAAKLVFVAQPSNTVAGSALNPPVSVQVEDAAGNPVPTGTVTVTVTLSQGTSSQGTFSTGVNTATAVTNGAGLATFSGLTIKTAATGYTLTATAAGLMPSPLSSPFTISPAAANSLTFSQQPTGVAAGATIAPPVTVVATDTFGNVVPGVPITLTITSGGGSLSGTPTQTTNAMGVATFSNLSINTAGSKILTATGAGLNTASTTFTVAAGAGTQIRFAQQPGGAAAGAAITPAVTVLVEDAAGNPVSGTTVTLTLSNGTATPTGVLGGTTTQATDVNGNATFNNLSVDKVGSYQLTATDAALTVGSTTFTITAGAATQVKFAQPPTDTTAGASISPPVVVQVLDAARNPVPNAGVTLTLAGGTGTLSGTTTEATDATGTVTFSTLSVNKVGIGYTLNATVTGLPPVGSAPFAVTAGAATQIAFAQQPTGAASGAALMPAVVVRLLDANGNPVSGTTVTLALSSGTGTLSGTASQITDAGGNASFTGLSVDLAGAKQLAASSGSLVVASNQFTITAGAATQIGFTQPPTNSPAGSVISPPVVVQVLDAARNPVPNAGVTLTLSNGTGTPTGTLSGTTTQATDANGNATFNSLSVNKAGTGYTLTAASGALTPAASPAFTITAAVASQISFLQQPADTVSSQKITPAVVVQLLDADGNPVPNASVTLTLTGGSGTLSGTASQITNAGGDATFNDLSIDKTGAKTLTASSSGLTPVPSQAFTVTPNAATQMAFVTQPSNAASGQPIAPPIVVKLLDANNNPVPNTAVTLSLTTGTGTLSGTLSRPTDAAGNATFGDLSVDLAGIKGLTASSGTLTPVTSNPFTVAAGAATQVSFTQQPQGAVSGQTLTPAVVVRLLDADNNPVAGASVTLSLAGGSGALGGATVQSTDINGNAIFSSLSVNKAGTAYTLNATVTGLAPVGSAPFAITAGAVSSITFTTQPGNTPAGTVITTVTNPDGTTTTTPVAVQLLDASGNPVPGASVTLALASGSTGTLGGTLTQKTGTSGSTLGVATFTDLTVDLSGTKQLTAASGSLSSSSNAFTIAPGPGTLAFTQAGQPSTAAAGTPLSPVVVNLKDSSGNPISGAAVAVSLSNGTTTPTGVLSGTTTQLTDSGGNATFSNLSVNVAGTGYTLVAAAKGVPPATSSPFAITAGAPASISFRQQPTNVAPRTPIAPAVTVLLLDAAGNPVPGASVGLTLASGAGALNGTTTQTTDAAGMAAFSDVALDTPGLKQLTAAAAGLAPTASTTFFVSNVAPTITTLSTNLGETHVEAVGDPDFTLTINGSDFVSDGEIVRFNGHGSDGTVTTPDGLTVVKDAKGNPVLDNPPLVTSVSFINGGQITAIVSASLVTVAGTADVTVTSPGSSDPRNPGPPVVSAPALFPILPLGPSADTAGNPHALDVKGVTLQYFNPGLQLFSVPFDYTEEAQGVNDVLRDFNPATLMDLGNEGVLAVWDPVRQTYALTPSGAAKQLALGQGYWGRFGYQTSGAGMLVEVGLKTRGPLAQEIAGRLDPQRRFAIPLSPGWNMIGDPFAASVSLPNVQAEAKDGTVFGLTDANNQGLVNQTFYKYAAVNGTTGYVPVSPLTNDKLDPYVGYWVHAYQACTLLVPQP